MQFFKNIFNTWLTEFVDTEGCLYFLNLYKKSMNNLLIFLNTGEGGGKIVNTYVPNEEHYS
jgi:hypothetical protein